jgi:hypothetical protein
MITYRKTTRHNRYFMTPQQRRPQKSVPVITDVRTAASVSARDTIDAAVNYAETGSPQIHNESDILAEAAQRELDNIEQAGAIIAKEIVEEAELDAIAEELSSAVIAEQNEIANAESRETVRSDETLPVDTVSNTPARSYDPRIRNIYRNSRRFTAPIAETSAAQVSSPIAEALPEPRVIFGPSEAASATVIPAPIPILAPPSPTRKIKNRDYEPKAPCMHAQQILLERKRAEEAAAARRARMQIY